MKSMFGVILLVIGCSISAQNSLNYMQVNSYSSPSFNLVEIDDFLKLLTDNKIQTVFYTDKQFIIQTQHIAYTISSNGYKNLVDYKDGNDVFKDGKTYYYAKELNLSNQIEVDYFNSEPYFTINDYHDAASIGIAHNKDIIKKFYGLISMDALQKNIRYANLAIYLYSYLRQGTNIEVLKKYGMTDQQIAVQKIDGRSSNGTVLLDNSNIDTLISKSEGYIKKLDNFNCYIIDIPLLANSEASFYYAFKLSQFLTVNELANDTVNEKYYGTTRYLTKENSRILSSLGFSTITDLLNADKYAITNAKDYYLAAAYGISKERLTENRALITELEAIKIKYLSNYAASQNNSNYNSNRADSKSICAFIIYNMLKLKKGEPITVDLFRQNLQKEYSGIYYIFQFENSNVNALFNNIQQMTNIIVYSNGSFYLK